MSTISSQSSPKLRGIPAEVVEELKAAAEEVSFRPGEVVFQRGEAANHALLLLSGRLAVSVDGEGGRERNVGDVWPGELVGESVFFDRSAHRIAWVRAVGASTALVLTPEMLQERRGTRAVAALQAHLIGVLARRIRSTDLAIRKSWQDQRASEARQREASIEDTAPPSPPTLLGRLRYLLGSR